MKVVFYGAMAGEIGRAMPPTLSARTLRAFLDDGASRDALDRALHDADVLVSMHFDARFGAARALRLLQVPGIGLDHVQFGRLPEGTRVAVCRGHEQAVAEYVLATVILGRRRIVDAAASLRAGSWEMSSRTGGPLTVELAGAHALVIGGGGIGRTLTDMFQSLGVHAACCTRFPFRATNGARVVGRARLHDELALADIVVLACALDVSSRHLIDTAALRCMRADAWLVNVARGDCVDEQALFDACRQRRIGGAVIDVWYCYPDAESAAPAPSRFPFNTLDNVLGTPHISAWTRQVVQRRADAIAHNVTALASGEPLRDEIAVSAREAQA